MYQTRCEKDKMLDKRSASLVFIIFSNSFNKFNNSYPHNYVIFPMLILLQACLLDNGCSHGVVEQIGETSHNSQETFEPEEVSLGIQ